MPHNKVLSFLVLGTLSISLAFADGGRKRPVVEAEPDETRLSELANVPYHKVPDPDWSTFVTPVGTPTTLTGFYDYQSNGGSIQHIRVNPANGNIHVTYMLSEDSTAGGLSAARRTGYAFSSNGGVSWNNFGNVRVPNRLSGFPTIDLLRGPNAGLPVIANHSTITGTQSTIYVDSPEGSGAFSELSAPPLVSGTAQPIWPYVAGASDGSVVMAAAQNIGPAPTPGVMWHNRMPSDFLQWGSWDNWTGDVQSGGRHPTHANGTGRVAILLNTSNGTTALGNRWRESTNNGVTWTAPMNLYGQRVAGPDTFNSYVHCDFVYNGDIPYYVFAEYYVPADRDEHNIVFWSQATGFRIAVPYDSTKYTIDPTNQRFHGLALGWPSIGLSGNTIVVAYQAFQPDTDSRGYHYSDLWYVTSTNGGNTWSQPVRLTNTPQIDERYPSVSKWNAPGQFNMTWSQKSKSGLFAFPGNADTVRTSQMFLRVSLTTDVGEAADGIPRSFRLGQNYPNPFNPATKIDYTVAKAGPVSIRVYNTLGQEVATLINEYLAPGHYQATFDAAHLASGVYIYKMTAGSYVESKRMLLLR